MSSLHHSFVILLAEGAIWVAGCVFVVSVLHHYYITLVSYLVSKAPFWPYQGGGRPFRSMIYDDRSRERAQLRTWNTVASYDATATVTVAATATATATAMATVAVPSTFPPLDRQLYRPFEAKDASAQRRQFEAYVLE
eukprot:6189019-Pleurochrysis_carterae.AAC.3